MTASIRPLFVVGLMAVGASVAFGQGANDNRLYVKFTPTSTVAQRQALLQGAQVTEQLPQIGVTMITLAAGQTKSGTIQRLAASPHVVYAEEIPHREFFLTPNDPQFSNQWMHNRIETPAAWDMTTGLTTVNVAIIDSGFQLDHPDMAGKITRAFNYHNNTPTPFNDFHGTHVAGITGAATNNGVGVASIGFNVRLHVYGIMTPSGGLDSAASIRAIIAAGDNGVRAINMSYGGPFNSSTERDAISYAISKGVLPIAAAGNNGNTQLFYPAAHAEVIAVASSAPNDTRSNFSTHGNWVDVAAPGQNILSTVPGSAYGPSDGTSMASPVVAGLAGLVFSANPSLTPTQVRNFIESTVDPVAGGQYVNRGRVNARKAVQAAMPIANNFLYGATSFTRVMGTVASGNGASLTNNDGSALVMRSERVVNRGEFATFDSVVTVGQTAAQMGMMEVRVTGRVAGGENPAGFVFLWNFRTNTWDQVNSFTLRSSMDLARVEMTRNLSDYVPANRQVRVRLTTQRPFRRNTGAPAAFEQMVDAVQIGVRERIAP